MLFIGIPGSDYDYYQIFAFYNNSGSSQQVTYTNGYSYEFNYPNASSPVYFVDSNSIPVCGMIDMVVTDNRGCAMLLNKNKFNFVFS